jgi:hypothetical protein
MVLSWYTKARWNKSQRRSRYKKYNKSYPTIARLSKEVKALKTMINVEKKHYDKNLAQAPDTTGGLSHLTSIPQGDDYDEREGRSVRLKSMFVRGDVLMHASATSTICRVIWFQWNDDTAPTVTDILENANVHSPLNLDKSTKSRILRDRTFNLTTDSPQKMCKLYVRRNNHCKFDGITGADYERGSLWVMYISDQATNTPTVTLRHRTRYIDN